MGGRDGGSMEGRRDEQGARGKQGTICRDDDDNNNNDVGDSRAMHIFWTTTTTTTNACPPPDPIVVRVAAGVNGDYWSVKIATMTSALIGGLLVMRGLDSISIWD
ncbi:hypothetical protein ACHAW5_000073 [Stephanodiscus triporus]|uniref:Uncharacterized protein n=1 Tax=Stephanodiscus triporus TaxID=2934178 RepID=A0ABD3N5F8_9STRA